MKTASLLPLYTDNTVLSSVISRPDVAEYKLKPRPIPGDGVNCWLLSSASLLRLESFTIEAAHDILRWECRDLFSHSRYIGKLGKDIIRAINKAYNEETGLTDVKEHHDYSKADEELIIEKERQNRFTFAKLRKWSPVPRDFGLTHLFADRDLVCLGAKWDRTKIFEARALPLLGFAEFICPNPMLSDQGNPDGNPWYQRYEANIKKRVHLVIEFDFKLCKESFDRQASLIKHLATMQRLVLVVYSGNKSLHSWFDWRGKTEKQMEKFLDYACRLGADRAMQSKCQWTRCPNGTNDTTGKRQHVIFYSR